VPELLLFDRFVVALLLPPGADEATTDAARAALDDPSFLDAVGRAVQAILAAVPALAPLSARAVW
jgi:hypothetical protein